MPRKEALDSVYAFMANTYEGNWKFRFADTPYMKVARESGKRESINEHAWACMEFWFQLRRLCPALNRLVDPLAVYEMLLNHDLGEIRYADTPLYRVVKGLQADDKESERRGLEELSASLPPHSRQDLLESFDAFEADLAGIDILVTLVGKWINCMQGNHFAMVFGEDFLQNADSIRKILQLRFIPITRRLMEALRAQGETEALAEVKGVAGDHLDRIRSLGIAIDADTLAIRDTIS